MQMSQTFCVLLSQLLFILGADARDNKVPYSIVKHIIWVDILRAELRSLRLKQSFIFLMFEMASHYFFKFRYFSITPKVQLSK